MFSAYYYYHWVIDPPVDIIDYTIYGTIVGVYSNSNSSNNRAGVFMQQPTGTNSSSYGYGSLNHHSWEQLDWIARIVVGSPTTLREIYGLFYDCYVSLTGTKDTRGSLHITLLEFSARYHDLLSEQYGNDLYFGNSGGISDTLFYQRRPSTSGIFMEHYVVPGNSLTSSPKLYQYYYGGFGGVDINYGLKVGGSYEDGRNVGLLISNSVQYSSYLNSSRY